MKRKIENQSIIKKYHYYNDCLMHVISQDKEQEKIMKLLISAGSGFFVDFLLPNVTHVVVENDLTTEEKSSILSIN